MRTRLWFIARAPNAGRRSASGIPPSPSSSARKTVSTHGRERAKARRRPIGAATRRASRRAATGLCLSFLCATASAAASPDETGTIGTETRSTTIRRTSSASADVATWRRTDASLAHRRSRKRRTGRAGHRSRCHPIRCSALGSPEGASWFCDSCESTACGFHAALGVAHKTLPCGTRVELCYRARCAVVTVEDRGPYVWPREWDLNPASKEAIGFGDTGDVRARVL